MCEDGIHTGGRVQGIFFIQRVCSLSAREKV